MGNNSEVKDSVKQCIDALKIASTDSEKFAALLVVAQIEKNLKLTPNERKAVYGSLDLAFLKKLLHCRREPDNCEKGTLVSLGLTILSCMVNELEEVSVKDQILDFVPRIVEIIYEINGASDEIATEALEKDIIDSCFSILLLSASNESGCKCIMHCWSMKSTVVLKAGLTIEMLKIIINCIAILAGDVLVNFKDNIKHLVYQASSLFSLSNNQDKFTLMSSISQLFITGSEKQAFNHFCDGVMSELQLLRRGLLDIIQSKVDKKQRHISLKLISILINLFGLKWTCISFPDEDEKYSKKFLHLVVSLTAVEIKMFFYDKCDDISLLSFLFVIVESSIESIAKSEDGSVVSQLGENVASKILQTITGTVKEVVFFLDEMKDSLQPPDACKNLKILACIRLLCAYMSEETQALEKEVVKIAPYMIELAKAAFDLHKDELLTFVICKDDKSNPAVIFMFLLPVLCHWSADDKLRVMLLEADFHVTLWEFFSMLLKFRDEAAFETIETLAGIFMNIAITEPKLASDPQTVFGPMVELLILKLSEYLAGPVQLIMNIVTLGLILARAQLHLQVKNTDSIGRFFGQCLHCFYNSCSFLHIKDGHKVSQWPQISELWFVGIDNFMACVVESKKLKEVFKGEKIIPEMKKFIEKNKANESEDIKPVCIVLKKLMMVLGQ